MAARRKRSYSEAVHEQLCLSIHSLANITAIVQANVEALVLGLGDAPEDAEYTTLIRELESACQRLKAEINTLRRFV